MVLGGRDRRLNVLVDVKGIDKANAELKKTESIGNKAAGGIGQSFKSTGSIIATLGPIVAGAFAVGVITNFIKEVSAIGVAVVETRSLIAASFGEMQKEIEDWSETSVAALTRTKLEVQETAAVFFNILQGMKLNREEAFKLSTQYVDLISDLASFNRALVTQEEVLIKVRAAATGEFEGLKQLGIVINEQIIKDTAYAEGLAEVGEQLDQATKAQAIFIAVMERAGPAVGDTVRTLDSAAGQIAILRKEIQETKEEIGERLIPVTSEWTKVQLRLVRTLTFDFKPIIEDANEDMREFEDGLKKANQAFPPLTNSMSEFLDSTITDFGRATTAADDFFGSMLNIISAAPLVDAAFPAGGAEPTQAQINAIATQSTLGGLFAPGKFKLGTGLGFQVAADKAVKAGPKGTEDDPISVRIKSTAERIGRFMSTGPVIKRPREGFITRAEIIELLGLDEPDFFNEAFFREIQAIRLREAFAGAGAAGGRLRRPIAPALTPSSITSQIATQRTLGGLFPAGEFQLGTAAGFAEGNETSTAAAQRRQQIQSVVLAAAAAGITGGGRGAGAALLTGGLSIAGAAIGGPFGAQVGGTIGGLLSGLLFRRRQRPQLTEPIPVTVVNTDDMATAFLKATQQALARGAGGGIDRIEELRQAQIQTAVA
jgi:hypothetical protein